MSAIKSILLHVDSSLGSPKRFAVANEVAEAFGADVTALYATTPSIVRYPYALEAAQAAGPLMQQYDEERRDKVKATFAKTTASMPRMHWAELREDPPWGFVRRAFYADLVILGQFDPSEKDPHDVPPDFVPSVVIDSGRPALVLPNIGAAPPLGRSVLIGWKETREAARAVTAALPWLQLASHVHVALWHSETGESMSNSIDIEKFLRGHGMTPKVHHYPNGVSDIAAYLLSLAADVSAGLIVMGCYGHSRMREWVLGGTTRTIMDSMTVPVLMTH